MTMKTADCRLPIADLRHRTQRVRESITRRHFFSQCGVGVGKIALASLLLRDRAFAAPPSSILHPPSSSSPNPLAPRHPHFAPRAKRVIYLFMAGAPSQLDLFDYKPTLAKYNGKPVPQEVVMGQKYAFIKPDAALYASEFKFGKHGQCGAELSEALPQLAEVVDDIAIVKARTTDPFNHPPGQVPMS